MLQLYGWLPRRVRPSRSQVCPVELGVWMLHRRYWTRWFVTPCFEGLVSGPADPVRGSRSALKEFSEPSAFRAAVTVKLGLCQNASLKIKTLYDKLSKCAFVPHQGFKYYNYTPGSQRMIAEAPKMPQFAWATGGDRFPIVASQFEQP